MLGHRRLSILDLSTSARQPMASTDGAAVLTFNGEIYNYIELKAELESLEHRFRTPSHTEVLLAALLEWGPSCLRRLNGMWAFALWSPRTRTLVLSRDRFGVKPLYFAHDHGRSGLRFGAQGDP